MCEKINAPRIFKSQISLEMFQITASQLSRAKLQADGLPLRFEFVEREGFFFFLLGIGSSRRENGVGGL